MSDINDESVHAHQGWVQEVGVVFLAHCNCGWASPLRFRYAEAQADLTTHSGSSAPSTPEETP